MSVEFELRASPRRIGSFDDLITLWRSGTNDPLVVLPGDDHSVWIFSPGVSIRGFSVKYSRGWFRATIDVRINVCASRGDWRLLMSLLALSLEKGARASEEGTPVRSAELLPAQVDRRARDAFARDLTLIQRLLYGSDEKRVTLPNLWFSMTLTPADLPEGTLTPERIESLHDALASRTSRYAAARRASVIKLKSGATAVVLSEESILAPRADFLVFPETWENPETEDYLFVPWDQALQILGAAAEPIGGQSPAFYFPADLDLKPLIGAGQPISHLS